jgi:hypothetical protein
MKKLLVTLAAVLVSVSAFAQGSVSFSNRTSGGDWKVALSDGTAAGLSASPIAVNIFLADASGTAPTGTSLGSTTFRTTPAAAAFFVTSIDEIDVTGLAPGSSSQKFVAQFTGANIQTTTVPLVINPNAPAGGGTPPAPPGELLPANAALLGSTLTLPSVPEPSTIALGVLGAAALLLRRRK